MNIASIFDWFAQDSRYAAAHADEPRQQDMWMKLADEVGGGRDTSRRDQPRRRRRSV
jgi:hypothetical protein